MAKRKGTRKSRTLRGTVEIADNALAESNQVLIYESPDRTRSWRISRAYFWPVEVKKEIGSADGQYMVRANLATDTIRYLTFDQITDPDDNRICAFGQAGYSIRHGGPDDFLAAQSANMLPEMLIDRDTTVTVALYFSIQATSESSTSPVRKWGYLVELEEEKVSPAESIILQLKGQGQDVSA